MRIGYARVSTAEQKVERQVMELEQVCDEVHVEQGVSAIARSRPVYEAVQACLQPGDTFVVHSLDRAFRSVIDALTEVGRMQERDIEFVSLSQPIDMESPFGQFNFTLRAAVAQLERQILSVRTKEGLEAARRRGKTLGRPRKLTEDQISWVQEQVPTRPLAEVALSLGVSSQTVRRALRR